MAKRKNQFDFNKFIEQLHENQNQRVIETEEERQYFLIVCEGEKTEPNYFNSLGALLPNHLIQIDVVGDGTNTLNVVQKAIELKEKRLKDRLKPDFDEVWAVFDKDDFPNERFNQAIVLGEKENIKSAYSNEAFELWYILHFQFLDAAISRGQYIDILKGILGNYEKNAVNIYQILQEKGNEENAIKWAKRLLQELNVDNPALEKPTTKVHELVERLNEFRS